MLAQASIIITLTVFSFFNFLLGLSLFVRLPCSLLVLLFVLLSVSLFILLTPPSLSLSLEWILLVGADVTEVEFSSLSTLMSSLSITILVLTSSSSSEMGCLFRIGLLGFVPRAESLAGEKEKFEADNT